MDTQEPMSQDIVCTEDSNDLSFVVTFALEAAGYLHETEPGRSLEAGEEIDSPEDGRFAVHTENSTNATLLIDSWHDETVLGRRRISFIWVNRGSSIGMWERGVQLLSECVSITNTDGSEYEYRIFSNSGQEIQGHEQDTEVVRDLIKRHVDMLPSYYEIQHGGWTFFSDFEPMDDIEKQAGLVLPRVYWDKEIITLLAGILSETNEQQFTFQQYEHMLSDIDSILQLSK